MTSVSDWAGSASDWHHALEGLKQFIAPAFKRSEGSIRILPPSPIEKTR